MTVTLKLDADTVCVGDTVKGTLVPIHRDSVTIELLWRTEGDCETEERIVASAEVSPADRGKSSFELVVPAAGPMSYSGQTFTISWCVRADGVEVPFTVCASNPRIDTS